MLDCDNNCLLNKLDRKFGSHPMKKPQRKRVHHKCEHHLKRREIGDRTYMNNNYGDQYNYWYPWYIYNTAKWEKMAKKNPYVNYVTKDVWDERLPRYTIDTIEHMQGERNFSNGNSVLVLVVLLIVALIAMNVWFTNNQPKRQ